MSLLAGRVAVVTGGSSGIGAATGAALAGEGARVVLAARGAERLVQVAASIGAVAVEADVATEEGVETLVRAAGAVGPVEILVNNVGVGKYGPFEDLTVADYDWMMDTNMRSSFLCTRAFLPGMLERGRGNVVFVASVAGLKGLPNEAVYCASKFAQIGFAQALDYETRERGVKVTVVAPGGVNTEFAIGTGRTAGDPALSRMLDPKEVAASVLFAVTQPANSRVFLIGMRPMSEPL